MLFLTSLTVYLSNSPAKKVKLHKAFFHHLLVIILLHFENTLALNSFSNFYKYIRFSIKTDSHKRFWYLENWKRLDYNSLQQKVQNQSFTNYKTASHNNFTWKFSKIISEDLQVEELQSFKSKMNFFMGIFQGTFPLQYFLNFLSTFWHSLM